MALTYDRPYQYVKDLRLLAVLRTSEHTMFIGTGFANDAYAWVEKDGTLEKLDQVSMNTSDYDVLTTAPFQARYPYTLYVVNPDDEQGHASNALTFTNTNQIPVIDVKVNGASVVTDQVANIDLTQYVHQVKQANMLYGTDADGAVAMYDLSQVKGVQNVTLNGQDVLITNNTLNLVDIARKSGVVEKVSTPEIIYGTDISGYPRAYEVASFAKKADLDSANTNLNKLTTTVGNKQDKDPQATDGSIAIMQGQQSVGSTTSLATLVQQVNSNKTNADQIPDILTQIQSLKDQITQGGGGRSDWKSQDPATDGILNNPVVNSNHSITITDMTTAAEAQARATTGSVVVGVGTIQTAQSAVVIGQDATVQGTAGIAIGKSASATTGVAIGSGSVAEGNVVSVGKPAAGSDAAVLRRVTNVDDPLEDTDAATKKYVDEHSGSGTGGGMTSVISDAPLSGAGTSASHLKIGVASSSALGVVKVDGTTITADASGTITAVGGGSAGGSVSVSAPITGDGTTGKPLTVATATQDSLGVVRPDGSTITVNNGIISAKSSTSTGGLTAVVGSAPLSGNGTAQSPLKVAVATNAAVGVVKIGNGFNVGSDGTISLNTGNGLTVGSDGKVTVDSSKISQKGLPFYCVNAASDTSSVQGEKITTPCFLAVVGSNPPQLIYSDGK